MTSIPWKRLLVAAGLLLLLTFLLLRSQNPDAGLRERMYAALHAFEVHDAELNRDVLLARAGLLPHYDSLTEAMNGLHHALEDLESWNETASEAFSAAIGGHIADLSGAVREKETLLEYFKADNALLRNSLTYFLHTGHLLSTQTAVNDRAVAAAIGTLSNAMLRFVRTPQREASNEIRTALNHMTNANLRQHDLRTLALHGHLIVDVLPEVDDLLRQLLAAPTTARVRTLRDASLRYHGRMEARARTYRILLYLVAVVLLAYLVYLFNRLRANARDLGRANASLRREMDERTRLEEKAREQELQLIQANKMTALGTLVAGVAHEINNPNNLTMMNARVVAEAWGDAQPILEDYHDDNGEFLIGGLPYAEMRETVPALIRDMHAGAQRIERIVSNLKDFARPRQQAVQTTLQVNEAVQRAVNLLRHRIGKAITFQVELAEGLPSLQGDAQQIEQVVVNLVTNALEALPAEGGQVTVSTRHNQDEREVEIEVRDSGIGIPRENVERLCDPFFTTKQEQGGTGLGLAITYTLVRDHGGNLVFESTLGQGTQARVTLPCAAESPLPEALAGLAQGSDKPRQKQPLTV